MGYNFNIPIRGMRERIWEADPFPLENIQKAVYSSWYCITARCGMKAIKGGEMKVWRKSMEMKKERSEKEYKDLMNRLKRIEGQVRGIQGMLENDAYCADVLTQVAAVNAALNSFSKVLLAEHVRTCVADNIRAGNDEVIDELAVLLQKLMR